MRQTGISGCFTPRRDKCWHTFPQVLWNVVWERSEGEGCNSILYVKIWLMRERGSLACKCKEQNMRTNVWQKGLTSRCVGGKKQRTCTVNGRGSFTLSFTPSSQSCHSTTYMAQGSHRYKSASELLSFGLLQRWQQLCSDDHVWKSSLKYHISRKKRSPWTGFLFWGQEDKTQAPTISSLWITHWTN